MLSLKLHTLKTPLHCGKSLSVNDFLGFALSVVFSVVDAFKAQSQPWLVLGGASGSVTPQEFTEQQYPRRNSTENSSS